MKKSYLLLIVLLCVPMMLSAENIDGLFNKWKKEYPNSATEKWEVKEATLKDIQMIREESGIADLEVKRGEAMESTSPEVGKAIRKDLEKLKVSEPYMEILNKTISDEMTVFVAAHKTSKGLNKGYVVFMDKRNIVVARVEGFISHDSYKKHIEQMLMAAEMMLSMAAAGK